MSTLIQDLVYLANIMEGSHPMASGACKAALTEIAAITAERDRLRDAIQVMADSGNYPRDTVFFDGERRRHPAEFARQALDLKTRSASKPSPRSTPMSRPDDSELVRELKEIDRCIQSHWNDANVRGVYPSGVWLQH